MQSSWEPIWTPPPAVARRALTLDEWASLDEDEDGELVDGYLVEEEMPDPVHELAVAWLIHQFLLWLGEGPGFVFGSEVKVRIGPKRGRKADLVVYLPGSSPPPRHGVLTKAPDILVEIVTPTPRDVRRDRVEKMREYESIGVRYYWLLDPAIGTLEIFELGSQGQYVRALAQTEGRIESVPGCPGFELDLDKLWARLALLAPEAP
ncbi:Uma2 family endonuclease [Pendulispora rubella]|uniref:Uma2 family endonuclease n=1 Tax=Pendulispora rubella TaxID=2741070 RepID=A0ABZ2LH02_9BACT